MVAALLAFAAVLLLPLLYLHDSRRARRQRGDWFATVLPLLDSYRVVQEGPGWPILTGRYRGHDVRLEPVQDDMAWRKLPSLWLKATVLVPQPKRPTLGLLVRARGGEFYSPTAEMTHRLRLPQGWPADAMLCAETPNLPLSLLDDHVAAFDDPRLKELVSTPKGVRLVYQADQASRAEYLVLRQARFTAAHADAQLVSSLLDRALAIATALDGACQVAAAA